MGIVKSVLKWFWRVFGVVFFTLGGAFLGGAASNDSGANLAVGLAVGTLLVLPLDAQGRA